MTEFLSACISKNMRSESYEVPYGEEEDDDDDDFDDDEFDELTDFEDDDDLSESRNSSRNGVCGSSDSRIGVNGSMFHRQRSASECSMSHMEPGDDNRRDHHNQLERKRRASIKTSYNDLREVIPGLRGSKASRAVILQRAVEYIEELVKLNRDHTHCVDTLKRKNEYIDLGNQEMQRHVQRYDDDEVSTMSYGSMSAPNVSGSGIGSTLRLYPGTVNSSGTTDCGPSTPTVYRLIPQDSIDRSAGSHGSQSGHVNCTPSLRPVLQQSSSVSAISTNLNARIGRSYPTVNAIPGPSTAVQSDFSGMNALSAAVSLLASKHSVFSSNSSSSGSNCEPAQSSSQRSSPGCLSSSSMSNASSNQSSAQQSDERSLQIDIVCEPENESCDVVSEVIPNTPIASVLRINPTARGSSPPSILLTVPIRPSAIPASVEQSSARPKQTRQLISVLRTSSDSAFRPSDISKRRRIT